MALPADLRAVNDSLRESNDARYERVFEAPEVTAAPPSESPAPGIDMAARGFVEPEWKRKPWLRDAPHGRWCVRYGFVGQRPFDRSTYRADSPRDVVRWLRDAMPASIVIHRIYEDVA